jgi:isopentenyl-diphosphate delta-isomerase
MKDETERVILVSPSDEEVGNAGKLEVHRTGQLHRAFSVFILDRSGRMLLQRRALDKYHSGGLWSNTCCGHPRPGELTLQAASRRLKEEMGIDVRLQPLLSFVYYAEVGEGLVEHELDHVLVGWTDEEPKPDPAEVHEWLWVQPAEVNQWLSLRPTAFTPWFRRVLAVA